MTRYASKPGPLVTSLAHSSQIRLQVLTLYVEAWPARGKPGPVPTSPAHSRPGDKPGPVSHNVSLRCWLLAEKMQDIVSRGAGTTPNHPPGETRGQCGWQRETREEVARGRWRDVALAGSAEPALVSRDTAIARRLHVAGARGLPPPRTPGACGGQSTVRVPELRCAPHRRHVSRARTRACRCACGCSRSPPQPRARGLSCRATPQ